MPCCGQGSRENGFSVTAMFCHGWWNSTTDQPQRAGLSSQYHATLGGGLLTVSSYVISNQLALWNDFTHDRVDPIHGDQEEQREKRTIPGLDAGYLHTIEFSGISSDVLAGAHWRNDSNDVLRRPTENREPLTPGQLAEVDYAGTFSKRIGFT